MKTPARKWKIMIVDDHPVMRQGLARLLNQEADLHVCAEGNGDVRTLSLIGQTKPDLILLDISLSGLNGIELIKTFKNRDAHLRILILSMHKESLYAERALRAGAQGYIMKQEETEKIVSAIRQVLKGKIYLSEEMSSLILQNVSGKSGSLTPRELSDREFEVLQLIGEGRSTRQIADELHLSVKTIESYRAHIKEKMKLQNATQLVQFAIEWKHTHR